MKTIVLTFLTILGFVLAVPQYETQQDIDARGIIETTINNTINKVLANLSDPINIAEVPVDFGGDGVIRGGLNASSVVIQGIKSLVANKISLNIFSMSLDMNIHITEILVNFKYWADMLLLELVPLYGDGRMNLVIEDIDISISGSANLTDGIKLKDVNVGILLGDATFDLNGLINNPEFSALISTALNDNFVPFIDNNSEVISKIISPILEKIINTILGGSSDEISMEADHLSFAEYRRY